MLPLIAVAASLAAGACSSDTVTDPVPATITEQPHDSGVPAVPAADQATTPEISDSPGSPSQPLQKDPSSGHPYAYLWQAAQRSTTGEGTPPRAESVAVDAVKREPSSTPDSETAQLPHADPAAPEHATGNAPERNIDDDPFEEIVPNNKNALPSAHRWRNEDLAELAPYLQGIASWYGPTFHGKLTANGETYNQYGLTAAHPVLPIGTHVLVENLSNGRKVWLRINDRGPYAKGRVLDLSRLAAERLGMIENGTAPVRITVLRWPDTVQASLGLKAYQQFTVQAAAYPDLDTAEELRERLQAQFVDVPFFIDHAANGFFAVAAGPFDDEREAKRASARIRRTGVASLVKRYRN